MDLNRVIEVYKVKNSYKVFICIWIIILLFFVIYFGYKMTSDNNQVSIQEKQVKQEVQKMSEESNEREIESFEIF
ncbi:hypothetical protein ABEY31_07565 [Bacillus mycoides]|uniref:hypothetical protein n=1 Tax=Bacillus cereus group TaxID=86661 RepID=UPI001F5A95BB|nr:MULTISPECIES: hypothetical protein [Bacillus cereus group]UYX52306.1 hypothetical protein M3Y14_28245 [Bacillus thuringiensis]